MAKARSSSGVSARRARCATYFTSIAGTPAGADGVAGRSVFIELALQKRFNFLEGLARVSPFLVDRQAAARTGGEHEQTHNAFPIHARPILLNENIAVKAGGDFNEKRSRPGVDTQPIRNEKIPLNR